MLKLAEWFKVQNWADIIDASCVNKKAELLQNGVLIKVNEYLPIKTRKIAIDDKPWFTDELKKLRRKICREYKKHRKSNKYFELHMEYEKKIKNAPKKYKREKIDDVLTSNDRQ